MDTGLLTIKEAAERLSVSEKTVRRWIKSGKLRAELMDTEFHRQYFVSTQDVQVASQVLDVVKVERPTDPRTLALAVAKAVQDAQVPVQEELARLRDIVQATHDEVLALKAGRGEQVEEAVAPPAKRDSWWRRLWVP